MHGHPPYGYRTAAPADESGRTKSGGRTLEIVETEAEIVRRIYRDARAGWTPGRIAREPNRDGIASPRGGTWAPQVVWRMLRNPAYRGERYGVKRAHPAIVSVRAWNAAQPYPMNTKASLSCFDGNGRDKWSPPP